MIRFCFRTLVAALTMGIFVIASFDDAEAQKSSRSAGAANKAQAVAKRPSKAKRSSSAPAARDDRRSGRKTGAPPRATVPDQRPESGFSY